MKHKIIKWISGLTLGAVLALGVSGGISEASVVRAATEKTYSAADYGDVSFTTKDNLFEFGVKDGGSNPAYNTTAKDIRAYAGAEVKLSYKGNDGSSISKVVFAISTQGLKRQADLDLSSGQVDIDTSNSKVTWTGSATEITFTVGAKATHGSEGNTKAGQFCFTAFTVTLDGGSGTGTGTETGGGTETGSGTETGGGDIVLPTGDLIFTRVNDASEITSGSKVVFAAGDNDEKVIGTFNSTYFNIIDSEFNGDKLIVDDAKTEILTVGVDLGCTTFALENGKKLGSTSNTGKNDNKMALDSNYKWNVSDSEGTIHIINNDAKYQNVLTEIRYNAQSTRICCYPSNGQAPISVYKLSGDTEKVVLENSEVEGNKGETVTLKVKETKGIDSVSSYAWEVIEGSEYVSLTDSGTDTQVVNLDAKGTAKVQVTVNGTVKAVATITVNEWVYDVLAGDQYFIANKDGKGAMGGDLSNNATLDFTSDADAWTFEKAYKGDNTYWLKNNGKYLTFRKNVYNDGKNNSAIILTDNKVDFWTIEKSGSYFVISTTCGNSKVSLAQDSDLDWLAFSTGTNVVALIEKGDLVYDTFEIAHQPGLSYPYVGDTFKDTAVKVNAVFTNGFKTDITSEITWGVINADGTVEGTYTFDGDDKVITLTGLNVYKPQADTFTVTGIKEKYSIGETVKVDSVKLTYKRDSGTTNERTLAKEQYTVSPSVVAANTTKITVSFNADSTIKKEFSITAVEDIYISTSVLTPGDQILFTGTSGTKSYEGKMETAGTNYNRLLAQEFDYAPTGESPFELESAGANNKFYVKDMASGKYLNSQVDGVLTTDKVETMESLDGKFKSGEFQFKPSDSNEVITITTANVGGYESGLLSYNASTETWNCIVYTDNSYMDYYQLEMIVVDDTALLSVTHINFTNETEVACEDIEYKVFNYNPLYLINPYKTGTTKEAFTFTYNENIDQGIHWWTIQAGNGKYVNLGDGKFTLNSTESLNVDIYRNKTIEQDITVTKLNVTVREEFKPLTVKIGENVSWDSALVVSATFEGGSHAMIEYGSYTVSGFDNQTPGEQTVTISYGGQTATVKVMVTGAVGHIEISNKDTTFKENIYTDRVGLKVKVNTYGVTVPQDQPLKFSSNNESVATVDQEGNVTILSTGTVTLKVTDYYELFEDTVTFTVYSKATGLSLDKTSASVVAGGTVTLNPVFEPAGSSCGLQWKSSDTSVATVNNGVVTGVKAGTAVITAYNTSFGLEATCTITVENVAVQSISITAPKGEIEVDEEMTLLAVVSPTNATIQDVDWSVSDSSVATISSNGTITGLKVGRVTVKATAKDGSGKYAQKVIKIVAKTTVDPDIDDEGDIEPVNPSNPTKPNTQIKVGCMGSVVATSAIISLVSIAGAGLLISKRKRK